MKAAVCWELGQPLVVEDVILDPPRAGEVRVRIGAVAICHSDVHLVRGDWLGWSSTPPPVVAGHEAAGIVEEVGPGVTRVRPYPLAQINEAIVAMEGGEALRNVIEFPDAATP